MKILHAILSEGFYGSERYCIELAIAQARAGHEVAVLVQNGDSECVRAFRREIESLKDRIALTTIPTWLPTWLHRPFASRALARFAPDIVHSHLNPAARRVGREAQKLGIPHVATLHIHYDANELGGCDGLIAVANWQLAEIGPNFRGEVAVVWNWVPEAISRALAFSSAGARLRLAWGADDATVVFGSVGRLMREKGMDRLVRAFRAAFPRGDEAVRLMIVGDGPMQRELTALAADDARIGLLEPREDIVSFYRACEVYVSAAEFEPFGLTILEAMAAGCPLLLTRTQGPREFVTDERVAWVEPGDEAGLAERLREAAAADRRRLQYDLAAFTPERAEKEIAAFYERVQRARNSRAR